VRHKLQLWCVISLNRAADPEATKRADLSEIWDYTPGLPARRGRTESSVEISDVLIEDHPIAGRARDEVRAGLRSIPARPYIIFYVADWPRYGLRSGQELPRQSGVHEEAWFDRPTVPGERFGGR
jgi:plasmid stabilization system protein ParE